jgi:hypothetical protein
LRTYYDLLSVEPTVSADEVKRAFRREIARYHPDKVQHLGPEFQEIAASRAAALTEAYRILMDANLRRAYDESIADGTVLPPVVGPESSPASPPPPAVARPSTPAVEPEPAAPPPPDRRFQQERSSTTEFLRKAVLAKVRDLVVSVGGESVPASGMDAAYILKGKKALFRKPEPTVRLLLKVVSLVSGAAVEESWIPATRVGAQKDEVVTLLLLGSGLATAKELSNAVSEQRRKTRQNGPVVVPVDMRDWEALFPPETPMIVRSLLDRLRQGE